MLRTLAIGLIVLTPALAMAQNGNPGAHFVENWDLDGDGQVTLEEATERRGDVFLTFDANDDGVLDAEEHDLFDEARAQDMEENGFGGQNQGQGQGKGQGQGQGKGQGHGKQGAGHGNGQRNPANGMLREFTDADGNGQVTREEFLQAVPTWFSNMDRNGDDVVTTADFGNGG